MGYSILTPEVIPLNIGGFNWRWASQEKDTAKTRLRLTTEINTRRIPSKGGHFAFGLFGTGAGVHGEVSPHPNHPGANRNGNPLWVRARGAAHGKDLVAFENWDGSDIYLSVLNIPGFKDFTGYRAVLTWDFCTGSLQYTVFELQRSQWSLVGGAYLRGWAIPDAQNSPFEPYWYGVFGVVLPPTSLADDTRGASDMRFFFGSENQWPATPSSVTKADPNYYPGKLNQPVSNPETCVLLKMHMEALSG